MGVEEQKGARRARLSRVEALYHEMLARPANERVAALAAACADDPELGAEVQSLLDQPESAGGLLARPAIEVAAGAVSARGSSLTGRRIGVFEVQELLGVGGMGEVYRGRDTRLGRAVAIKILPRAFRDDPDRMARFEREARMLASLNHPNIGAVYGLESTGEFEALVLEFVEGEDLAMRISRGPISIAEALPMARQMAEGIEAAHEKGIIHRDLKPANIMVRNDGTVKVLDFGLAKARERAGERGDPTESPTLTARATEAGMVMGTAAYMAPEQARGRVVDRRADIWSFGVVLYEMLTGKRAFKGEDVAAVLASVLRDTPPLEALPRDVPPRIKRLIERCLDRDPKTRLRDIGEARIEIARCEAGIWDPVEPAAPATAPGTRSAWRRVLPWALAATSGVALVVVALTGVSTRHAPTSFQRLTSRVGAIKSAHFASDGDTIVFSASRGSRPLEVFSTRASKPGERPLGLTDAVILAVSSQDDMALLLRPQEFAWTTYEGTLAHVPLSGGAPRELLEGVVGADWSPDGKALAVIHVVGDRYRLEYPIGTVLYEASPPTWMSDLSFSPSGDTIAFTEHPVANDKSGGVSVIDLKGRRRGLATGFPVLSSLHWSPDGKEIWFGAGASFGSPRQIWAVSPNGTARLVEEMAGGFLMNCVSPKGQVLGARVTTWYEVRARDGNAPAEVELPATEQSTVSDLSDDGRMVLGTDQGEGGGENSRFFLQRTDGSPELWLGEGDGQALSPDGRFALSLLLRSRPQKLLVVPTGAGETRTLDPGDVVQYRRAVWDSTGRRVVFSGMGKDGVERVYVQDASAGPPRVVSPDDVGLARVGRPVSPDGGWVVALGPDGVPALYSLQGGERVAIPGLGELDVPLAWRPDGRELYVARYEENWPRIDRVEIKTGRKQPWTTLGPLAPNDILGQGRVLVSPDGRSYAYSYARSLSDLYVTSPLK